MQDGNRMGWYYPCLFSHQTPREGGQEEPGADRRPDSSPAAMYPCYLQPRQPPALYTYYAIMSLVVVVLAVSLMWIPFVQLIAESNTIISKVLIYVNRELLGDCTCCGLSQLGEFFNSQHGLVIISICCLLYLLYLASADFLLFTGCYIYNLPNLKYLRNLKEFALGIIEYLLSLMGKAGYIARNDSQEINRKQRGDPNETL